MQEEAEKKKYETPQMSEVLINGPVLLQDGSTVIEDDF